MCPEWNTCERTFSSIRCSIFVSLAAMVCDRADVLRSYSQVSLDCSAGSQKNHRLPRLPTTQQENIAFITYASQIGQHFVPPTLYVTVVIHRILHSSTALCISSITHQMLGLWHLSQPYQNPLQARSQNARVPRNYCTRDRCEWAKPTRVGRPTYQESPRFCPYSVYHRRHF